MIIFQTSQPSGIGLVLLRCVTVGKDQEKYFRDRGAQRQGLSMIGVPVKVRFSLGDLRAKLVRNRYGFSDDLSSPVYIIFRRIRVDSITVQREVVGTCHRNPDRNMIPVLRCACNAVGGNLSPISAENSDFRPPNRRPEFNSTGSDDANQM